MTSVALAIAATQVAPGLTSPAFAEQQSSVDAFGFATTITVGGIPISRTRDALGNITSTPLAASQGTLHFDGFSRLREVQRADGADIHYGYRPDGVLVTRNVTCNGAPSCVNSTRTFVYAGLPLLEEYEGTQLRARYYYADQGCPSARAHPRGA